MTENNLRELREQFIALSCLGNHKLHDEILSIFSALMGFATPLEWTHIHTAKFADGEPDEWIADPQLIKGRHVVVFQSARTLDELDEAMTLAWSARMEHGAKSVTGVFPFMRYRRQDNPRKDEINRLRMTIRDMGHDRFNDVIFCDMHNEAATMDFCKEANIRGYNADPSELYADKLAVHRRSAAEQEIPFYAYAPDAGSLWRSASLASFLRCDVLYNKKDRSYIGTTAITDDGDISALISEITKRFPDIQILEATKELVKGAYLAMREDEVSTGNTATGTGKHLIFELEGERVYFWGTHPVCVDGWQRKFVHGSPFFLKFMGNTLERGYYNSTGGKIINVSVAPVMATKLEKVMRHLLE